MHPRSPLHHLHCKGFLILRSSLLGRLTQTCTTLTQVKAAAVSPGGEIFWSFKSAMDWLEEKETNAFQNITSIYNYIILYHFILYDMIIINDCIQISGDGNFLYSSLRNPSLRSECTMRYLGYLCNFRVFWGLTPPKKNRWGTQKRKLLECGLLYLSRHDLF